MTVATVPAGARGHAHTAKLLGPSYCPTAARSAGAVTLRSKSASDTRFPLGPRGHSFVAASVSASDTALHSPTRSALRPTESVAAHGPCACAMCGRSGTIAHAARISRRIT